MNWWFKGTSVIHLLPHLLLFLHLVLCIKWVLFLWLLLLVRWFVCERGNSQVSSKHRRLLEVKRKSLVAFREMVAAIHSLEEHDLLRHKKYMRMLIPRFLFCIRRSDGSGVQVEVTGNMCIRTATGWGKFLAIHFVAITHQSHILFISCDERRRFAYTTYYVHVCCKYLSAVK